eukprot:CAMPEP_0196593842 /NCGR_PEP_ID=MMETSP1081-20130531/76760_1 /TAXON_ID=36882 /ORGANISM="Pyramimonas amylifera, Strain CCMP720" /LENGTH=268 /DNA_ID=CAMNT_0041917949 /DNA_START=10 /DNA_END=816 /DNA_ORIENTATION=+
MHMMHCMLLIFILILTWVSAHARTFRITKPSDDQHFEFSQMSKGVPLQSLLIDVDLSSGDQICWSFFRMDLKGDLPHGPPSCSTQHRPNLIVQGFSPGSYRALGSLVSSSGEIIAHSPIQTFHVDDDTFISSYEWTPVTSHQDIPAGLEVELPLDGSGKKRARIPPVWRLQVDLGPVANFMRLSVQRSTTVQEINEAAAQHISARYKKKNINIPVGTCLRFLKDGEEIPARSNLEEVDWFGLAGKIHAGFYSCHSEIEKSITWNLDEL